MNPYPLGYLAAGTLIGAGIPFIKRRVRGLALLTAEGTLTVNEKVRSTGKQMSEGWNNLVQEIRSKQENRPETFEFDKRNYAGTNVEDELEQTKKELAKLFEETREELQAIKAEAAEEKNS
ncbi:MAG: hypothetical protein K9L17_03950 [Clostridiales bacterium]|nr:hypothetical protein [Clostridiales bacterium]MCF8021832.1 hypothetical protein [Clostridiales bacterium]